MNHVLRLIWRILIVVTLLWVAVTPTSAHPSANARPPVDFAASANSRPAYQTASEAPTNQIIIKYKATADISGVKAPAHPDRISALSAAAGVPLKYFREMSGDAHVLRLPGKLPVSEVSLIASKLMTLGDVEYAEPDRILQHMVIPNDPQYASQWHYFDTWGINAPGAWDITTGSSNVVVAVIDTGITDHADLSGRTLPGYDFISDVNVANDGDGRDSNPSDPGDWITSAENASGPFQGCRVSNSSWHGTHVAGTIGAATNNGLGVAGINWVSKIVPVRVLGKCGGYNSDILDGMRWAAGLSVSGAPANPNPAKVLNLSLGGLGACGASQQAAIDDITNHGTTVVVAAGNSNVDASGYNPASCNGVITVAATNRTANRAYYSNYGSVVEISAPGGETNSVQANGVLSTLNSGTTVPAGDIYTYYQGTSMATPHIVGVASLVLSMAPTLSPAQVQQILQNTARAFPGGSTCNTSICGVGIVDAAAAVGAVPRITSFNPTSVATGSGAFKLIVNGANLASDSVVKWNGSNRATYFVNSTQITATIPASDVAAAGAFSITVSGTHPTYGSITTNARPFVVLGPDVSIQKSVIGSNLKPGDRVTFTLSISNVGGVVATSVVVTDIIPPQVLAPTYGSSLPITRTGVYTYVWNVGTLGLGQGGVITIYGRINPSWQSFASFANHASISAAQDNTPGNNTSHVTIGESKVYLPMIINRWPTVQLPGTLYSSGDACVMQGRSNTNFGSAVDMWAGYDDYLNPDGMIVRSLVKFDTSAIPVGTSISSAVLRVYMVASYDYPSTPRTITPYRVGSSWTESGVIWNSQPSIDEAYGSASITSEAFGWYSFDVTNLVRGWVNGTLPNYGIMLRGPEVSGADSSWRSFSTREGTFPPQLVISYPTAASALQGNAGVPSEELGRAIFEMLNSKPNADTCQDSLYLFSGRKCLARP